MLDPNDRLVYLDALRPPPGYRLDQAIGTTFSLDLLALLIAPLAFAFFEHDSRERALADPVALLDALRRSAERITVFYQEGRIAGPATHHLLYGYLEPMVVEVRAPDPRGVFHPKTWLLRYIPEDAGKTPVRYRFLCLSRNVTFDRTWDTVLSLEGDVVERSNAFGRMNPLGDFIAELPRLAVHPVPAERAKSVDLIQREIRRTRLMVERSFDDAELRFWPLGLPGYHRGPFDGPFDRFLVMSPFVSSAGLAAAGHGEGQNDVLISREDSLDDLVTDHLAPAAVQRFKHILVLDDRAADPDLAPPGVESADDTVEDMVAEKVAAMGVETLVATASNRVTSIPAAQDDQPASAQFAGTASDAGVSRQGLHAKLYIGQRGAVTRLWVGSANATGAALPGQHGRCRNVELLVELAGPTREIGIEQFLGDAKGVAAFGSLLCPWRMRDEPPPNLATRRELDEMLEAARQSLIVARCGLAAQAVEDKRFDLVLRVARSADLDPGLTLAAWPVTIARAQARRFIPGDLDAGVVFPALTGAALTRLMAFEITAAKAGEHGTIRFVLNLPVEGIPEDRDALILHAILSDRQRFLRYLLFLLADERDPTDLIDAIGDEPNGAQSSPEPVLGVEFPLFEVLIRALARSPDRIGRVARLVTDLRRSPDTAGLLPEGFEDVWAPIEAVWRRTNP